MWQPQTQQTVRTPRFLGVHSLIPHHQTWERRIDLIPSKYFHGCPRPRKYFYMKNENTKILQHKNFQIYSSLIVLLYLCMLLTPLPRSNRLCWSGTDVIPVFPLPPQRPLCHPTPAVPLSPRGEQLQETSDCECLPYVLW